MNKELKKIRIRITGPILQDGPSLGRKWHARGLAKLGTQAGHRGRMACLVVTHGRWASTATALSPLPGRGRRCVRDGSNWHRTSRRGPPSYRASARKGLEGHPVSDDNGGAMEWRSPTIKHSGGGRAVQRSGRL
jgi:hypothetical protein